MNSKENRIIVPSTLILPLKLEHRLQLCLAYHRERRDFFSQSLGEDVPNLSFRRNIKSDNSLG